MELTIEQALRQGIVAHKEGKLPEAEKLYRAVLGAQPQHPDANHNLGVLAVGVGRVEDALPHFKIALAANPKVEQFWLSYIDALIKLGQEDVAGQVLKEAQEAGLQSEKFNQLNAKLNPTISSSVSSSVPDKKEIDGLIALYNQGNLQEALVTGNALAARFPDHATIPNILGAVYTGLGRHIESIGYLRKAIKLKPDYYVAYNNLGNAFNNIGDYEKASISLKKAIELK